jgi:peptidoglycan/LPS O-acetylase OafA/YrhL
LLALVYLFGVIKINCTQVVLHLLLLQAWGDYTIALSLNYPGWSLSVEVVFYLLFPLVITRIYHHSARQLVLSWLTVWIPSQLLFFLFSDQEYLPLLHLNTFFGGLVLGLILKRQAQPLLNDKMASLLLAFSFAVLVIFLNVPNPIVKYSSNGLLSPVFACLITGLVYSRSSVSAIFASPAFVKAGEISYCVYILHYPCLFINRYINDKLGGHLFTGQNSEFYTYIMLLLLLSLATYHLIEMPAKKFFRKQDMAHVPA